MNKLISFSGLLSFLFALMISVLIPSCENMKNDPLYVGIWQFNETIGSDNLVYNTTRTLKLTKRSYEEIYVIRRENAVTISALYGMRGNLLSGHSSFTFSLKELGTCVKDEMDMCTEEVRFYGPGSSHYDENIMYYQREVKCEMEADQFRLLLVRDLNNDGDTDDSGENVLFERI